MTNHRSRCFPKGTEVEIIWIRKVGDRRVYNVAYNGGDFTGEVKEHEIGSAEVLDRLADL